MNYSIELIIVLGGGISKKGDLPDWVHKRLELAARLFFDLKSPLILLSGKGRDNFPITEAVAMKKVLIEKDIPVEKILIEELSKDTLQNAFYSKVIHVDPLKIKKVLVITSEFHMERSKLIFDNVMGPNIKCYYEAADNVGIAHDLLESRKETEKALMQYYQDMFSSIQLKDLHDIHNVIFNSNDKHYIKYHQLGRKLKNKMVLY